MSTANKRKAPSASYHVGEEAYLRAWVADGSSLRKAACYPVDVLDADHNFEKGGWTHKVRSTGKPESLVFEVHESQLYNAQYKEGEKVRVSRIGLQSRLFLKAVVKAVRHHNHAVEYDLAVDLEAVKASEIVGSLEGEKRVRG